ncbi:sensor histidine kinase [Hymenobacter negativus]|uniref:Histidine kinase n=1 Tax=Hymenobacter negativus TaxID=2795026 RepID=A0ABS0Q1D6_9BACT|nr:histidine kinase [Hymenobacter negativus]MBH8556469.1 histidine kinase [Hymenobacter negativus]
MPALNDRRFLLGGIPLLSLAITVVGLPNEPDGRWPLVLMHWVVSLYFTTGYWLANRQLWMALLARLPRPEQTPRRLWLLAGLAVLITAATSVLLILPLHALLPKEFPLTLPALLVQVRFSLVPTVAVLTLYETMYFFEQWKTSLDRAEALGRAQNQAQLEALQNQLDPHFLFNNLNTLSALIEPDNAPAQDFVEQLADVYRYVLLAQGRATVPLAEELAFVETYLALHKARFRDNLRVEMNIAPAVQSRHVAPLSVQLLVENALKHNVASREHPLHLRLVVAVDAPDVLVVENTLRLRTAGFAPGTGTGLANVRRRYTLLGAAQTVEAGATDGKFVVKLPLLPAQS